jgi:N-methylhydantoinase A
MARATIDVGGTFTDVLILEDDGGLREFKVPTTPEDPAIGLLNGLQKAAAGLGYPARDFVSRVDVLIHGTTLATNALLTGRGARVGMLTTQNFRDLIEIRCGQKNVHTSMYNIFVPPYRPLVPRYLRLGVEERTLYSGEILTPLNADATRTAVETLKQAGVEAVAICLLHAYANPEHERTAAAICREHLPEAYVTTSHEVLPVWREFERFSTTVVSAYVGPLVDRYLARLDQHLAAAGFAGTLLLVQSDGLVQSVDETRKRAVFLICSGPAAAPTAAIHCGRATGHDNLISVDMGGTSFDACLIHQGEVPTTTETWIGEERVAIKMVDVHTVGAGGGSIGWIDSLGLLRVGPQSAGADPGPACYGKGGTAPTVTDADLVLGYLAPDYFLGGEMPLDPERARRALDTVGAPLGLDTVQTAQAMFTTVNAVMADKITELSTKQGHDVRDFALVAGGGAGPIHAAAIAERLGIETIVVPHFAALCSAFGMLVMDVGRSYARSYVIRQRALDVEVVNQLYAEMEVEAVVAFQHGGVPPEDVVLARGVDCRYVGQFHEVEVAMPPGRLDAAAVEQVVEAFHRRHHALYTFSTAGHMVEFLTFRLKATARTAPIQLQARPAAGPDPGPALKRTRACYFGDGPLESRVYAGEALRPGNVVAGPAIVEEPTTTIVIPPAFAGTVDPYQNYVLRRQA